MIPIEINDIVQNPAFIKYALRDFISNKYKIPNIVLTQPKPAKKPAGSRRKKEATPAIVWDEERLGQLPEAFLKKVFQNMGNDADATVCFGTTGKGIRPSYQVVFGDKKGTAFSGSGHNPLKKPLSKASKKISQPFSHGVIDSILLKK